MFNRNHLIPEIAVCMALCAGQWSAFGQGTLTPPGAPTPMFKSLNQIEPRTPVAGGGAATISQPGSYYLTGNIAVSSGNGVTITVNHVTLDLNGFTISSTANPASGTGILLSSSLTNICIRNGSIFGSITNNGANAYGGAGFASGVSYTGNQPVDTWVIDLSVSGVTNYGINLNSNVGNNTGNTVEGCLVNDCGNFGIVADKVLDSFAKTGTGSAIFSSTSSRVRGVSYASEGLHAALSAENCSGQSTNFYGMNVGETAVNCYAQSTSNDGLICSAVAQSCYGQTATGSAGISAGTAANNCYGYHTGAGGDGLFVGQIAYGCLGINGSATGTGIRCTNIVNSSIGSGGATPLSAGHKYNCP